MSIENAIKKLSDTSATCGASPPLNDLLTGIVAMKKETVWQAEYQAELGNYREAARLDDEANGMVRILLLVSRIVNDGAS
ncbi:MAG: hypothetical protein L3J63_06875 [Geopsychrobacter sp.]|nr:hypothetical protein [Geopsychrobacter sp.]